MTTQEGSVTISKQDAKRWMWLVVDAATVSGVLGTIVDGRGSVFVGFRWGDGRSVGYPASKPDDDRLKKKRQYCFVGIFCRR